MTDNTPMGKDQDHRSNALAIAGLGVLIAMNILCWAIGIWPSFFWQVFAIVGTIWFAVVNFRNTVETNEPWKSYGAFLFLMAVVVIYVLRISQHAVNQP